MFYPGSAKQDQKKEKSYGLTSSASAMGKHLRYAAQLTLLRVAKRVDNTPVGEQGDMVRTASHLLHQHVWQQSNLGRPHTNYFQIQ
jgi:hypothetical protein